mmetsp:Transcript_128513/g.371886  ORF Transcript_128513/g.371886 Transcript_128513/m.371886 type:complete len:104 (-) Transcript_128513:91-402(-)
MQACVQDAAGGRFSVKLGDGAPIPVSTLFDALGLDTPAHLRRRSAVNGQRSSQWQHLAGVEGPPAPLAARNPRARDSSDTTAPDAPAGAGDPAKVDESRGRST